MWLSDEIGSINGENSKDVGMYMEGHIQWEEWIVEHFWKDCMKEEEV